MMAARQGTNLFPDSDRLDIQWLWSSVYVEMNVQTVVPLFIVLGLIPVPSCDEQAEICYRLVR
jgi:hypothetical protein